MKTKKSLPLATGFAIWLAALVFAGFNDLAISLEIADPMSVFGRLLEIAGEPPAILFASFNLALTSAYNLKAPHNKKHVTLAALSLIGTLGTAIFTCVETVDYISDWRSDLSLDGIGVIGTVLAVIVATMIAGGFLAIAMRFDRARLAELLPAAKRCILAAVLTLGIIWAFKLTWGRVRFRQLEDLSQFTPFWKINGFNGFFSFPSGHTANATVILTSTYHMRAGSKYTLIAKLLLGVWVVAVALSRVLVGAHYLSDVLCGGAITFAIVYFCKPKEQK